MDSMVLDGRQTIIIAILVFFLGKLLIGKIAILRDFNIPEPLVGGLIASIVFGRVYVIARVLVVVITVGHASANALLHIGPDHPTVRVAPRSLATGFCRAGSHQRGSVTKIDEYRIACSSVSK